MIFLTLGTQLPFDRLVEALDIAAASHDEDIIAQTCNGIYKPKNFSTIEIMDPATFDETLSQARIVISHAGIGTLLTGLKYQKPLVVMARLAELNEHRNDHQLATVEEIKNISGVYVAKTAEDISNYIGNPNLDPLQQQGVPRRDDLIDFLKQEISSVST